MPTIRSIRVALASCALAGLAPPAAAEHVELTIALSTVPGDIVTTLGGAVATVVFDTDAPPTDSTLQSVTFTALTGHLNASLYAIGDNESPSIANAEPEIYNTPIDGGELVYSQAGDRNLAVHLFVGEATLTLTVFSPGLDFTPSITSLPDDPAAYTVLDETDYVVFGNVLTDDASIFANLNRTGAFFSAIGGVSYNARLVPEPTLPPCNQADLSPPFGQLDFDDILAFLTAFGSMDLTSDLALPNCAFDFDDVLAFLVAYGQGCP